MNYLIAVTVKNLGKVAERQLYRVAPEATLKNVVDAAVNRSELTGQIHCQAVEVLGVLQPHLYETYTDLLDPKDVTDLV